MSVTIDMAGLPPERIVFSPSPLAELGAALHVLGAPAHHPGLHSWATATASALKPDLADRLCEADFLWTPTFSDIFLAFAGLVGGDGRPGSTLTEELDMLDRLDDERFVSAATEFTCSSGHSFGAPSPLASGTERDRALEMAAARGPCQAAFTRRLLDDPPQIREWVRRFLEDCDEAFFADTWRRVRYQLAADARHKTELLRHKGAGEALSAVSPAVTLDADGRRLSVDKMTDGHTTALDTSVGPGVTCVPTSMGWPHLLVLHAKGWRPVIHYPVAAPELPAPGSTRLLQQRLEALANPARIRLARFLARGPYTTGELADATDLSAPEVSRHLAVLKKAGLLTTRRRGRYVQHQLEVTTVARLGSDFLEGVLR
jgi:DNA-binding transcriptional ArsR family regulator